MSLFLRLSTLTRQRSLTVMPLSTLLVFARLVEVVKKTFAFLEKQSIKSVIYTLIGQGNQLFSRTFLFKLQSNSFQK
jgi:hypothetical protein